MGSIVSICLTAPNGTLHVHLRLAQALGARAEELPHESKLGQLRTAHARHGASLGQPSEALGPHQQKARRSPLPGAACIMRPLKIFCDNIWTGSKVPSSKAEMPLHCKRSATR